MESTQSVVWNHATCVYRPACISSVHRTVYHQCTALYITHASHGISSRLCLVSPVSRHSEPWRRIQKAFLREEGGAVGDGRRIRLSTPYIFAPNHACGVYGIRNPLRYGICTQCRMASTQSVVWNHATCVYGPACISSVHRTVYHQCIALYITHASHGISSRLCLASPVSRHSAPYISVPNHACGVYGIRNLLRYGIGT